MDAFYRKGPARFCFGQRSAIGTIGGGRGLVGRSSGGATPLPGPGRKRVRARHWTGLLCLAGWLCAHLAFAAKPPETSATVSVRGYGLFGDRRLTKMVQLAEPGKKAPPYFQREFIEDAALMLFSKVADDGYLKAKLEVEVTWKDGSRQRFTLKPHFDFSQFPRKEARHVEFRVVKGVRYYYRELAMRGLVGMSEDKARQYFIETQTLLSLRHTRIYSPERLKHSIANLQEALERKGYESVRVAATQVSVHDRSGAVDVTIQVQAGPLSTVRRVEIRISGPETNQPPVLRRTTLDVPYSLFWQQDFVQGLRTEEYKKGYPDPKVQISVKKKTRVQGHIYLDLLAEVHTGPFVRLNQVKFVGNKKTRTSMLRRWVRLKPGEPLNRLAVEQGRNRLARLGIFDTVDFSYENVSTNRRNVVYTLKEGKKIDVNLLFGYGSYELLRGGVEVNQYNLFGLAHQARLRLIQSFKSSSADYLYTMPEFAGHDVDVFLTAAGLRRKEISFIREEYGGSVGAQRFFSSLASRVGLRYNYQFLNAQDAAFGLSSQVTKAVVSSLSLDLKNDHTDNPLLPRQGYKLNANLEFASAALGGEVDYQRLEVGGSVHFKLGGGRFLHLGAAHGVDLTLGGQPSDLPFNKRFFPGGENSIRGYQQGQAAPRNSQGQIIGAETYLQGNIELEQALTPDWSLVVFVDGVGFAQDIKDYPVDQALFSAGGGVNWRTIIGPVRLEYGYNLNPRPGDPSGTVQLSIGFPF